MQLPVIRVSLSEDEFAQLVRGKVVDRGAVLISLADIGWARIYFHIERAMRDSDRPLEEHL